MRRRRIIVGLLFSLAPLAAEAIGEDRPVVSEWVAGEMLRSHADFLG
jgi:hypothetical protein